MSTSGMVPGLRSYNTLWRRMRRRYWIRPVYLIFALVGVVPWVCMVAWLWRDQGWGWLAQVARWLWLVGSIIYSFLSCWATWLHFRNRSQTPLHWRYLWIVSALSSLLTTLALVVGQVDWAVFATYGIGAFYSILYMLHSRAWHHLLQAALSSAIVAAFVMGSPAFVIVCLLLRALFGLLFKPSLRETVIRQHSKDAIVNRARQQCASGGG